MASVSQTRDLGPPDVDLTKEIADSNMLVAMGIASPSINFTLLYPPLLWDAGFLYNGISRQLEEQRGDRLLDQLEEAEDLDTVKGKVTDAAVKHKNLMLSAATATTKMILLAEDIDMNMRLISEDEYSVEDVKEALAEVADEAQEIVRAVEAVKNELDRLNNEVKEFRAVYEKLSPCAQREEISQAKRTTPLSPLLVPAIWLSDLQEQ
ncbi:hypothetical protein DFJ73DRAFT_788559 [Zopfochytrium polystomum]|nr:hypothetical protein DFJ73DRAFT_788559 [Zopfochytrium polystomum]